MVCPHKGRIEPSGDRGVIITAPTCSSRAVIYLSGVSNLGKYDGALDDAFREVFDKIEHKFCNGDFSTCPEYKLLEEHKLIKEKDKK